MLKGVEGTVLTKFDYQSMLIALGIVVCGFILLLWIGVLGTLYERVKNRHRDEQGEA